MLGAMRTVIASADPDLTIALQFALRNEAGFTVIASVSSSRGLSAVASSSTVDLFVIDGALGVSTDVIQRCRLAGPFGADAAIAVLAGDDEVIDDADVVVRKRRPTELLDVLRTVRHGRCH